MGLNLLILISTDRKLCYIVTNSFPYLLLFLKFQLHVLVPHTFSSIPQVLIVYLQVPLCWERNNYTKKLILCCILNSLIHNFADTIKICSHRNLDKFHSIWWNNCSIQPHLLACLHLYIKKHIVWNLLYINITEWQYLQKSNDNSSNVCI